MHDVVQRNWILCEMLGIKYPIFQGAMARITDGKFAAEVSGKGALGVIAAGGLSAAELETEITVCQQRTDKPFAVNLALKNYNIGELLDVVIHAGVKIVITGAGNPEPYVEKLKEHGIKVIPVVASATLAKRLCRYGVDAIIAEGSESGGHIGSVASMCLVPAVCDAVSGIPVIGAGGVADGRGMAAMFALGAWGVQIGTRFLATKECTVHPIYKDKVIRAKETSTIVLNHNNAKLDSIRALKTPLTNQYLQAELTEVMDDGKNSLLNDRLRMAAVEGDLEGLYMAGQSVGIINSEETIESILWQITEECKKILGI